MLADLSIKVLASLWSVISESNDELKFTVILTPTQPIAHSKPYCLLSVHKDQLQRVASYQSQVSCTIPFAAVDFWRQHERLLQRAADCDVFCCVSAELAQAVVDAGAVPLLILCLQEPELALKRVAASSLSDICKHSLDLAQTVVDAGAIAHLAQMILNPDAKLKVVV